MGGKSGKVDATDYRLSVHYAVCVGPVDAVEEIVVNDKRIGIAATTENAVVDVDQMGLFGGPKKSGGVRGKIHFLLGGATQVLSTFLAAKLKRTPETVTGYRNLCSVFFTGFVNEGFTWSTNLPSVPAPKIKVRRAPVGLGGDAMIGADANPSHIIYECLTNTDWGAGYSPGSVDDLSFDEAAEVLREEGFGLSMIWTGQTKIEDFINTVLQQISATLIFDLSVLQWRLKLLRADYDANNLVEINPRNAEMLSFQRRAWGEAINEVVLTWTNPVTEQEETVAQQDATGVAIQGGIVSDSSASYVGIRSQQLAYRVAERHLRQAGTPLAAIECHVSVALRGLVPGDVLRFNWDEIDEDGDPFLPPIIVRVLRVKEPTRGAAHFEVSLLEDVFSYGASLTGAQTTEFETPNEEPVDVPFVQIMDSPYFALAQEIGDSAAQEIAYPRGHITVLAATGLADLRGIDVYREQPVPEMPPAYVYHADIDQVGRFVLEAAVIAETTTVMGYPIGYVIGDEAVGGFLLFGGGADQELCVVTAYDDDTITVRRGCLDTMPRAWPIGTPVWQFARTAVVVDGAEVAAGETSNYKLLPVTSLRRLDLDEATAHAFTVGERLYAPLRPANVKVAAVAGFAFTIGVATTSIAVSWSNRNRLTETANVLAWDDIGVTPEAGQETTVRLMRGVTVLADEVGVTGGSTTLDVSAVGFVVSEVLVLEVWATRSGFASWQKAKFNVTVV